jgi:hypothetical protein
MKYFYFSPHQERIVESFEVTKIRQGVIEINPLEVETGTAEIVPPVTIKKFKMPRVTIMGVIKDGKLHLTASRYSETEKVPFSRALGRKKCEERFEAGVIEQVNPIINTEKPGEEFYFYAHGLADSILEHYRPVKK